MKKDSSQDLIGEVIEVRDPDPYHYISRKTKLLIYDIQDAYMVFKTQSGSLFLKEYSDYGTKEDYLSKLRSQVLSKEESSFSSSSLNKGDYFISITTAEIDSLRYYNKDGKEIISPYEDPDNEAILIKELELKDFYYKPEEYLNIRYKYCKEIDGKVLSLIDPNTGYKVRNITNMESGQDYIDMNDIDLNNDIPFDSTPARSEPNAQIFLYRKIF